MLHVFIDTNIFLNFYALSKDHLDKLDKVLNLIKEKKVHLFITPQIIDEFNRNRESKLAVFLKNLGGFTPKLESPVICHQMPEMVKLQEAISQVAVLKKDLEQKLVKQINDKKLYADKIIQDIFSVSQPITISNEIIEKARKRMFIGNPPGKDASHGDAINWVCLLESIPPATELYFIGVDGDFLSKIDQSTFSPFLSEEWTRKNGGKIIYYPYISEFLKDKFPEVKITKADIKEEKEENISCFPLNFGYPRLTNLFGPNYTEIMNTFSRAQNAANEACKGLTYIQQKDYQPFVEACEKTREALAVLEKNQLFRDLY